jgi:fructose-specific phosphotransferase system component IIB
MKLSQEDINKSVNLLTICQVLLDDLEDFEQKGLYRHNLKNRAKMFKEELEKTLNSIYDKSSDELKNVIKVYEFNEKYLSKLLSLNIEQKQIILNQINEL